ncbi:nucleotide exchange factor GrpE [Mycoplasma putrefaciens]|nr:nucleotide exchange factor GrpE [Mycoplasma putrefaciens]
MAKNKSKKDRILEWVDKLDEETKKLILKYVDEIKDRKRQTAQENQQLKEQLEYQKQLHLADIANLTKKYNQKEAEIRKYGSQSLAKEIIQPIELLKKVVNTPVNNDALKAYVMGFEMISNQLLQTLENNHIKPMNVKVGEIFDSNKQEAAELVENSEFESNRIVSVISDGYMLHDKVLIYALVKVAK